MRNVSKIKKFTNDKKMLCISGLIRLRPINSTIHPHSTEDIHSEKGHLWVN